MSRIAIGVIRKAHGIRGEASVEPWTDSVDRFEDLTDVTLVSPDEESTRDAAIESYRPHGDRALVKFAGLDSPESLRPLQGWTIEIPEEDARELEDDEYFLHDLIGLTLVDTGGKERGKVTDILEGGGGLLLVVTPAKGRPWELPFAAELCTEIDLDAKRIVAAIPGGLDDLDSVKE